MRRTHSGSDPRCQLLTLLGSQAVEGPSSCGPFGEQLEALAIYAINPIPVARLTSFDPPVQAPNPHRRHRPLTLWTMTPLGKRSRVLPGLDHQALQGTFGEAADFSGGHPSGTA